MHYIEHYYNILYYFFYRGFIRFSAIISVPVFGLYFFIYKIPYIKNRFKTKGIDNPLQWHKQKFKEEFLENPKLSLGTIIGHGLASSILLGIYFGFYHIVINLFSPGFEDIFLYTLIIISILAYGTDIILTQKPDQGVFYIQQFNKKTGWWRIKWSIITALSPFFAIWFAMTTTQSGDIGRFILSHNKQLNISETEPNNNKKEQNEQDILNKIKKYTPDRIE